MRILNYILRRLAFMVVVLFGVSIITFTITMVIPGDPALMMAGPRARPEVVANLRDKLGLNDPLHIQYTRYIGNLLQGDLGMSIHSHREVLADLTDYFPATFELTSVAIAVSVLIGIPLGVLSAVRQNQWPDHISRFFALVGVAMPSFWLGLILMLVFYLYLDWFPGGGRLSTGVTAPGTITGLYLVDSLLQGNWQAFVDAVRHLVLPVVTEAMVTVGMITRITRSSMLEVLREEYVTTARAKGLAQRTVFFKHALKNAILPVVTMLGMMYGYALAGSVLVETVFSWPGMGRYAVRAITFLDFPAVMGVTLWIALLYVTINLVVDIAYFYIDPRVRFD